MNTPDSSVLVAAAESHHEFHEAAGQALAEVLGDGAVVAHALAETYSTLTGPGFGRSVDQVGAYLDQVAHLPVVWLLGEEYRGALAELAEQRVAGASIYDGLIALAARNADLALLSFDRRARRIYERLNVKFEILA